MDYPDIIKIITYAGIIQGFLLGFSIMSLRKKNKTGKEYLSILILAFSLATLGNVTVNTYLSSYRWHMFFIVPLYSLIAPLGFLYISSYTGFTRKIQLFWHLLPFVSLLVLFGLLLSGRDTVGGVSLSEKSVSIVMSIQISSYTFLSFRCIYEYRKKIIEYY